MKKLPVGLSTLKTIIREDMVYVDTLFDILLFIQKNKAYGNYWFETGTPSFIVKLFRKNRYFLPNLYAVTAGIYKNSRSAHILMFGNKRIEIACIRMVYVLAVFHLERKKPAFMDKEKIQFKPGRRTIIVNMGRRP